MNCMECGVDTARIIHLEFGGRVCTQCYSEIDESYQPFEYEEQEDVYDYIQKISTTAD